MASTARRCPVGTSDAIRTSCSCDPSLGRVVLFYAYVPVARPKELGDAILKAFSKTALTGKIRIAREGINCTAAGDVDTIDAFVAYMTSIKELGLEDKCGDDDFWKRELGCAHAFATLSVRVVDEIVPFGARELDPNTVSEECVDALTPEAWHAALKQMQTLGVNSGTSLLDVRNFYESRIGHFKGSTLAPIRRFSQIKEYLQRDGVLEQHVTGKEMFIFCTGGVRCEKVAAYLTRQLPPEKRPKAVHKLDGGIVAYSKRIGSEESLFKGSNYVFDARGSVKITNDTPATSWCDGCQKPSTRLGKCAGRLCHYVIITCEQCPDDATYCCASCREQTEEAKGLEKFKRRPCECDCFEARERRCAPPPTPTPTPV